MEISDIVNSGHIAFNLFIKLKKITHFLKKLITLFSCTFISVVIDCIFGKKVTSVKSFNLKYQ